MFEACTNVWTGEAWALFAAVVAWGLAHGAVLRRPRDSALIGGVTLVAAFVQTHGRDAAELAAATVASLPVLTLFVYGGALVVARDHASLKAVVSAVIAASVVTPFALYLWAAGSAPACCLHYLVL